MAIDRCHCCVDSNTLEMRAMFGVTICASENKKITPLRSARCFTAVTDMDGRVRLLASLTVIFEYLMD